MYGCTHPNPPARPPGGGLELLTHTPGDYHPDLRKLVTEWVCFNMVEEGGLKVIRQYFPGVDKARDLPPFHFLAYNRESKVELAGRL